MIGFVSPQRQAVVKLQVFGRLQNAETEVVVDTGFNGFLTLPTALIEQLNLETVGSVLVELADGSETFVRSFETTVLWNEAEQLIRIQETAGMPLLGMRLLEDHEVHIQVRDGGIVEIQPLEIT